MTSNSESMRVQVAGPRLAGFLKGHGFLRAGDFSWVALGKALPLFFLSCPNFILNSPFLGLCKPLELSLWFIPSFSGLLIILFFRYRVEYEALCKVEAEQNEFIDQFIFQK
jgi:hypothetical protein